jgi:hypothetical protein
MKDESFQIGNCEEKKIVIYVDDGDMFVFFSVTKKMKGNSSRSFIHMVFLFSLSVDLLRPCFFQLIICSNCQHLKEERDSEILL